MSSPPDPQADVLRKVFLFACRAELQALKPGNVHIHANGHGMTVSDFLASADAAAEPLCRPGASVGERILGAVTASWRTVPCNTNLGIILLAAPLVAAAESGAGDLRTRLGQVLDSLSVEDARLAYEAIARAQPAGLGEMAEQDVRAAPTVTLRAAMQLAAERDRIARQYVTGYDDVFSIGVARLAAATADGVPLEWATTLAFLDFLAAFPDSHIARKYGDAVAEEVRQQAVRHRTSALQDRCAAQPLLLAYDTDLKARRLNPGSSADLTVASLLAWKLAPILAAPARGIG